MRTLFTAFILVLVVNALALAGLTGYLASSGRLNKQRVKDAVAIFSNTLEEQAELDAQAEQARQETLAMAEQALRMEQIAGGPVSPEVRLQRIQQVDEGQRLLIERRKVEVEALQRQLDSTRKMIEQQLAELEAKQFAFDQAVAEQLTKMEDEDFQEAIAMLEGIPPKQAKGVFQELLQQGAEPQVVAYLAAMEERKAAGVLKEFKAPNELAQAARLIEQLRTRTDQVKQEANL